MEDENERKALNLLGNERYPFRTTYLSSGIDNMTIVLDAIIQHTLRKCRLDGGVIRVHKMILKWARNFIGPLRIQISNQIEEREQAEHRISCSLGVGEQDAKKRIPTYLDELFYQRRLS
jgi:hypothetical protein